MALVPLQGAGGQRTDTAYGPVIWSACACRSTPARVRPSRSARC